MTFGEKIQKLRKESGLSQEELSYQLGVSRQAISKWERDNGYPETEKIIRMSKIYNVTLDYLLNEDEADKPKLSYEEQGLYVNREMVAGFISYQKVKMRKIGIAIGLFIGSCAFSFSGAEIGILLFMIFWISSIALLFSVKLADNPYRKIWTEPLLFDKVVKDELTANYTENKQKLHFSTILGIVFIAVGFLFMPLITPVEQEMLNDVVMEIGMVLAGIGAFLSIYASGIVRAYRVLIINEEYRMKRKAR